MTLGQPELAVLRAEVTALDSYLLAGVASQAPDPLRPAETVAVRAFLILSHAAVEEFVESAFLAYVKECLVADGEGRVHPGLYLTMLQLAPDIGGQVKRADRNPATVIAMIPGLYESKVTAPNNGVKGPNIQSMALAAGLSWPDLEDDCKKVLPALATLGAKRGEVAHVSSFGSLKSATGVQQSLYPADVRKLTSDVLDNIMELLGHIQARAQSALPPSAAPLRRARRRLGDLMRR